MKTAKVFKKLPLNVLSEFAESLTFSKSATQKRLARIVKLLITDVQSGLESSFPAIQVKIAIENRRTLRKDLNTVLELLMHFLSKKEFEKNKVLQDVSIQKVINRYSLKEVAEKFYRNSQIRISSNQTLNNNFSLEAYNFRIMEFDTINHGIIRTQRNRSEIPHAIKELNQDLTEIYLIENLKLALLQYSAQASYDISVPVDKIEITPLPDYITQPTLLYKIYKIVLDLIQAKSIEKDMANEAVHLLATNAHLGLKEFKILYSSLSNAFAVQTNKGNKEFEVLNFQLHKLAVERNVHSITITNDLYREIIIYACKANEFEWALKYSGDYKYTLPIDDQETAYSFNKARIYINMKQYEDVITTLRDVEYKDTTYNLNSKLMLMVSFYELDEYETLLSTIRAFKVFLRRRRNVSVARKANFTGFCDALYNIMVADEQRDSKRIWKAKEIIEGNPAIPNTGWLKEKIEELKL